MSHTKGPWEVTEQDKEIFITDNLCVNLCAMVEGSYVPETIEANAKLIAAAPELLEALKETLLYTKRNDPEVYRQSLKTIAKAEGA